MTASNSKDVYEYYMKRGDSFDSVSLLSYAMVEAEKYEWMNHYEHLHGGPPPETEITRWFLEKPDNYFVSVENDATEWIEKFGRELLADEISVGNQKAIEESFVHSIE